MKLIALLTAVAALAATALFAPVSDAQTTSTREFEGTVVSVDRSARTFRLRNHDGRGTVTIRVTNRTRFERVTFASLKAGDRNIESTVRRSEGRWVALEVERSGRDDDSSSDDSGSDDDSRGGSGRGRDHAEDD
jgi:hypothetical protein